MRYKVVDKTEKFVSESIKEIYFNIQDKEFNDNHTICIIEGLKSKKILAGEIYDRYLNMFDITLALVNYNISFYNLLTDQFITSKLNRFVLDKDQSIKLRVPMYKTEFEEEAAYLKEEARANKELLKNYIR